MVRRGMQLPAPRQLAMWPQRFPDAEPHPDCTDAQRMLYLRLTTTLRAVERSRQERGWSWATVARTVGITDRALRNLRAGRSWPDLPTFVVFEGYLTPDEESSPGQPEPGLPANIVARVGTEVSPHTQAVDRALLEVAVEEVLPAQPGARVYVCVFCELVRRVGDHKVCPQHGGNAQDVTYWQMVEHMWEDRLKQGTKGARRGRERMRALRELADSYARTGPGGQRVDPTGSP